MRFLIQFEYTRVKKYEKNIFNNFDLHTIISDFDKQHINISFFRNYMILIKLM